MVASIPDLNPTHVCTIFAPLSDVLFERSCDCFSRQN